jgi:dynein heavy chain
MVESVRDSCRQALLAYASRPRDKWVLEWPGQVVLAVSAVFWTQDVGQAIASGAPGALQQAADR